MVPGAVNKLGVVGIRVMPRPAGPSHGHAHAVSRVLTTRPALA